MPPDDRERSFENALASHLRASSSTGNLHSTCSDAEILAAYHERSLPPEQMASLQAHVADCERCQQILAHLQATDEIPIAAPDMAQQASTAANSNVRVLHARKPTLWRWVAPAGALAATLLVWVAVREEKAVRIPAPAASVDVKQAAAAKNLRAPSPALAPSRPFDSARKKETASSDALTALDAAPAPPPQTAGAPKGSPRSFLKQKDSSDAENKAWAAAKSAQVGDNVLNREVSPAPEDALQSQLAERIETGKTDASKIEAEAKAANARRDAIPGGSRQQAPPAPAPPRGAIAGAAPAASSARAEASPAAAGVSGGVTQQQEIAGMSKFSEKAKVRLANSIGEVIIAAPGGLVSWRVGPAGIIEVSSDAGKTWALQSSPVTTDLLAGSAPSDKVCWIVGGAGTILRTTDGGAHWQRLRAPVQEDIRTVVAVDARQATVSFADGSYQTTDGGVTWNKLTPE